MVTEPSRSGMEIRRSLRQNSIYVLPNSFTIAALFSAFYAITQAMHGYYETAAIAVFISMLLDGMDGRVARWTNSQSAFGEQLDSLADMVSFGVAPALIAYKWQLFHFGKIGYTVAFIYCACAALRLALFNTLIGNGKADKRWFVGVPSPTAAALIVGLIWVNHSVENFAGEKWWALFITLFETRARPVVILPRLQPVRLCDVRLAVLEKTAAQAGRTSYRIPINRFGCLFRRPPFIRLQRKTII